MYKTSTHSLRSQDRLPDELKKACRKLGLIGGSPLFLASLLEAYYQTKEQKVVFIKGPRGSGKRSFAKLVHTLNRPRCAIREITAESLSSLDPLSIDCLERQTQENEPVATTYISDAQLLTRRVREKLVKKLSHRAALLILGMNVQNHKESPYLGSCGQENIDGYLTLHLPSLKQRAGDASLLCRNWIMSTIQNADQWDFDCESLCQSAEQVEWPQNLTSLRQFCSLAPVISIPALNFALRSHQMGDAPWDTIPLPRILEGYSMDHYLRDLRKRLIDRAVKETSGNLSAAARLLGITPQAVSQYLRYQKDFEEVNSKDSGNNPQASIFPQSGQDHKDDGPHLRKAGG